MNYNQFIQNIINTRGQWARASDYIELHHIVPICCGGKGNFKNGRFKKDSNHSNCIWLTAAEHFTAHKLLALDYPDNYQIVHAFVMMCECTAAASNKRTYEITAEDYELCKILRSNVGWPEETRHKISLAHVGKKIQSTTGEARRGKHYYTNGIETKMFFEIDVPDESWKRVNRAKPKQQKECKPRPKHQTESGNVARATTMKNKNLKWYNNGITELRANDCPDGYVLGRCKVVKDAIADTCKKRNIHLVGEQNGMYGKHHSEQAKKLMSEWSSSRHWFNNEIIEVFEQECPEGFLPGRLKRNKINDESKK